MARASEEQMNKIKPSDLETQAQELRETGKMPKLEDLLKAVADTREEYAGKIVKARNQAHPGINAMEDHNG